MATAIAAAATGVAIEVVRLKIQDAMNGVSTGEVEAAFMALNVLRGRTDFCNFAGETDSESQCLERQAALPRELS